MRKLFKLSIVIMFVIAFIGCSKETSNIINSSSKTALVSSLDQQKIEKSSRTEKITSTTIKKSSNNILKKEINLYPAAVAGKYGFIDDKGNMIIRPQFDYVHQFKEGLAVVQLGNKYGYIDDKGNIVLNIEFKEAYDFCEGFAAVKINKDMVYIDKKGKVVIDKGVTSPYGFSDGLAAVELGNNIGFMNNKGIAVIPPLYKYVSSFSEGMAAVLLDQKYGFIDKSGKMIIKQKYDYAKDFKEGLSSVFIDGKWGFINNKGEMIIEPKFDTANNFSESLAAVSRDNKYGFIDKTGNIIIDCQYENVNDFKEGLAWANLGESNGYIDKKGNMVIKLPITGRGYQDQFNGGKAYIIDETKNYYIDRYGSTLWKEPDRVKLGDKIELVKNIINKNGNNETIVYPQLDGIENKKIQDKINLFLKGKFNIDYKSEDEEVFSISYRLQFNKNNIINIIENTYSYYKGAAHGNSNRNSIILNMDTGEDYILEDLFIKNSNYNSLISQNIIEQIKKSDIEFIEEFKIIDKNEQFYLDDEGIVIFFPPYKYTPYAAGYIEFKIPYKELDTIINKDSELWKSMNK